MNQPGSLENEFHAAMLDIFIRAKEECGHNAARFFQMVANDGGLRTAKNLLAATQPAAGFFALWQLGRLDLTAEFLVIQPKFQPLFDKAEIEIAKKRLMELDFPIDSL